MLFDGGFTFTNFIVDVLTIFMFVIWIWLLITVFSDLFRRRDVSGWGKAIWVIFLLFLPFLAVLFYLITQGTGMTERSLEQVQQTRNEIRRAVGYSAADEIKKLDELKKSGSINQTEYARLRSQLIQ
jgi:hypothetical protein